ncbi:hypothetical protein [Streptomyces cinnamoneus]|uniref:hypothetical protein n=1 Tax=Streptomyces cinnamoneus TaxID=53446 RepID=UPI0037B5E8BA
MTQAKTETILAWEDDPGTPPSKVLPVMQPTPEFGLPPLRVGVAGPRPSQSGDQPGTVEFRYWTLAAALSGASALWAPFMPEGVGWHSTVGDTLAAVPDAGDDLNAFYDRRHLNFFHHTVAGVTVYSGESSDVSKHECGHAVLDALRPQLWDAASAESAALHEAFGDISALLSALQMESLRVAVLTETQGDLARSSRVSRLADQLAWAIRQVAPTAVEPDCLRNAANNFFYRDPVTLPSRAPAAELASEPHSFARVFSGAFLRALAGIFRQQQNRDPGGLAEAVVISARLLAAAVLAAPVVPGYFAQVAAHMVAADQELFGGEHGPALRSAFVATGILSTSGAVAVTPETVAPHAAAMVGTVHDGDDTLTSITIPGERYGLTEAFSVRAPAHTPRFAVTSAAADIGGVQPAGAEQAAAAFVEDLFRLGRVQVPEEHLTAAAVAVDGPTTKTHTLTRSDAGGLALTRLCFL